MADYNPNNMFVISDDADDGDAIFKMMNTSTEELMKQMTDTGFQADLQKKISVSVYMQFSFKDPDLTDAVGQSVLDFNTLDAKITPEMLRLMTIETFQHYKRNGQELKSLKIIDRKTFEELDTASGDTATTSYGFTDHDDQLFISKRSEETKIALVQFPNTVVAAIVTGNLTHFFDILKQAANEWHGDNPDLYPQYIQKRMAAHGISFTVITKDMVISDDCLEGYYEK